MASPDMLIDSEVLNFINIQMNTVDYRTLRQYLLEKRPFASIEKAIEGTLSDVLAVQMQQDAPQKDTTAQMEQLKEELLNNSYAIFTKQLEVNLQRDLHLSINVAERQALKQILALMKTQQEMATKQQSLMHSLIDVNEKLRSLELSSAKHKKDLEQAKTTIDELLQAQPNHEVEERINTLLRQVYFIELPIELSFFAVLVVLTLVPAASPVLFSIMAGIVLFSAIGGIMSIKSKLTELWGLQKTRDQNTATIQKQTNDIDALNEHTIPALNSQIETSKQRVTVLESELKALQNNMEQLQKQIRAITPSNGPASAMSSQVSVQVVDTNAHLASTANPVHSYKAPMFFRAPLNAPVPLTPPPEYYANGGSDNDQPGGNFPEASAPAL